jgi:hypothetical protein
MTPKNNWVNLDFGSFWVFIIEYHNICSQLTVAASRKEYEAISLPPRGARFTDFVQNWWKIDIFTDFGKKW